MRDTSADGLMVGASVMTGGAAVAALGGASFFKGVCRFQDGGSVGASVMEGAGSFAFAYVKLGKEFTFKEEMVLALVQAPWTTGTELVGGSTISKAVASGAVKLTGPSSEALFKLGPAKTLFDKVAVPDCHQLWRRERCLQVPQQACGRRATEPRRGARREEGRQ